MNQKELVSELKRIGVTEGMNLEVHSSLSSFDHVDGGAEAVIGALKECVGEQGSIFMPALRLSPNLPLTEEDRAMGIVTKIKILPEDRIHSAMGTIADTFRQKADTITGNGIMQVSGWGKHGMEAKIGGLNYVLRHGGKGLLLGVDIYKLTAMHYVEEFLPKEIGEIFAPSEAVNQKYPKEEWFIECGEPPVKAWYTIQRIAMEHGIIQTSMIGSCKVMFFDLWDVVSIYEQELKKDPYALYGIKHETNAF